MGKANIMIKKAKALALPKVEIETNESKRYIADLSDFKSVYCFPKNQKEWSNISITASGFNLTWGTRFEVHIDQILDSAESVTDAKLQA
jgi:hypothetical protein